MEVKGKTEAASDALASEETKTENNNVEVCEICKFIIPKDMTMLQHVTTSQHDKVYKAMRKNDTSKGCFGLYIRGYLAKTDRNAILSMFAKYGNIIWAHFGYDFLLLDYRDEMSMVDALRDKHFIDGRRLHVDRKEEKTNNQEAELQGAVQAGKRILDKLKDLKRFSDQYKSLIFQVQPDLKGQQQKCHWVCEEVVRILREYYPHCQVFPFGSTMTGLSFQNSDLDIYISGINDGEDVKHLFKIRRALISSQFFTNSVVIAKAKIPIMKCVHVQTNLNCDLNIRNMLGVCNSKLISYYLRLAPSVRTVVIILKFWAKVHRLSGSNHLFTNYSLILMLLFALQQAPYHLPTVCYLQSDPAFHNYQDGWNGGFREVQCFSSKLHNDSVKKILMNFFRFYSEFDFDKNVVNPYSGYPIEKEAFRNPERFSAEYPNYLYNLQNEKCKPLKIDACICVQDPFEHSRNATPVLSGSTLVAFINLCRCGVMICEEGEDKFLYKIFTAEPKTFKPQVQVAFIARQCIIPMGFSNTHLNKKVQITDKRVTKKKVFKLWVEEVNRFTKTVLCDIFCFELKELEATSNKNMKKEGQNDIHDQANRQIYKCAAMLNMWSSRKAAGKLPTDLAQAPILEKEIAISKKLLEFYKDVKPTESLLECEVSLTPKENPACVMVEVKKVKSYKKIFKSFGDYFISQFPQWFSVYEKEMCRKP